MLNFFRKIRRKLSNENKFIQYSRYAVGEIVLVMVGILLALQVNNWNEERKDYSTEKELLGALKTDFLETKARLNETIKLQNEVVLYSRHLLILFETNNLLEKKDSIAEFVTYGALSWWRAEPVTGTFDAMVSTGDIGLLKNKKLRRYLAEFNAEIKSGFEDHEYSMDLLSQLTIEQSAYPFNLSPGIVRNNIGLPEIKNSEVQEKILIVKINELKNNKRFFGILSSKLAMDVNRLRRQEKMILFVNNVLNIIETELKK